MPRHAKRLAVIAASIATLLGSSLIPLSHGDLNSQISSAKSSASSLQAQINSYSSQIAKTSNGVAAARAHLAQVQSQVDAHVKELRQVQTQLMQSRDHLLALEKRLRIASSDLAANLRAEYENGPPNLVDVVLNSKGFNNLLEQVSFIKRIRTQDAQILNYTQTARARVLQETNRLGRLEQQDKTLTNQILSQRNQVAAIEAALVKQQISEESKRSAAKSKLSNVNSHLSKLQSKLHALEVAAAKQAQQTGLQVNQQVGGLAIDTGGMVQPPPGAPAAVKEMIAAGNAIATLPYIWGGGHGSFVAPGYDCSGSVSYVLAAAGLLSSPEVSGALESYGDPGPGQWVTIYANAGHVWMQIAGWRFDTVALAEFGTRWSRGGGEFAGFVVRHPVGL